MIYYIVKVVVSALLIVIVSEIAKRNTFAGAVIASLPLISILAFVWIYIDTGDTQRVSELSRQIFWLVIPSLILFVSLPVLLKSNVSFYLSMAISISITAVAYIVLVMLLKAKDIQI